MDFFIEAGKSLNDKDRTNNNDLAEIQAFFEPIDRLFGDYEIRKKYGLENCLYRKNADGEEVRISKEKINENRGNLLYFIILDSPGGYIVQHFWVKPEDLMNDINKTGNMSTFREHYNISKRKAMEVQLSQFFHFSTEGMDKETNILDCLDKLPSSIQESFLFPFKELIVLDPIKLVQACDLDEARIISLQRNLINKCIEDNRKLSKWNNEELEPYFRIINIICDEFKELKKKEINPKVDVNEMEDFANKVLEKLKKVQNSEKSLLEKCVDYQKQTFNIDDDGVTLKEDVKKIVKEFNANTPLTKLKNFEPFKNVKIRLGKYQDGRFVLFLHAYESESNMPIRIPTE